MSFLHRAICCALIGLLGRAAMAIEPLHERIDDLIARSADGPLAEPTTDAEFLRRVTLDLAGRIPTSMEIQTFL